MRIFLSYGPDSNEELVRRIKADLEKRGHDVWFDKSDIRFGDDWRRQITNGITGSNRVLSFLSKYSTRDPGVNIGGVDYYDEYYAICLNCFWAWHRGNMFPFFRHWPSSV